MTNGFDTIKTRAVEGEVKVLTKTLSASDNPRSEVFSTEWVPAAESFACLEVTDTGGGMSKE
jgi:hypothetical protein